MSSLCESCENMIFLKNSEITFCMLTRQVNTALTINSVYYYHNPESNFFLKNVD